MRKTALTLLATLMVAIMMALSTTVAAAGWSYEDCPPYAQAGKDHMSAKAYSIVKDVYPPAADPAWKIPAE